MEYNPSKNDKIKAKMRWNSLNLADPSPALSPVCHSYIFAPAAPSACLDIVSFISFERDAISSSNYCNVLSSVF